MNNDLNQDNKNSWKSWGLHISLHQVIHNIEALVRNDPTNAQHRWSLFEILCVIGDWSRALRQLQMTAKLDQSFVQFAQTMRMLIRAEVIRSDVFSGKKQPVPVIDRPQWMVQLVQANALNAEGNAVQADDVRLAALEVVPIQSGVSNLGDFAWLGDSDTRLGPVCEVILSGSYRWLAFSDIEAITLHPPKHLIDLIWRPVHIAFKTVQNEVMPVPAFIPSRYPVAHLINAEGEGLALQNTDKLLLSKETIWEDVGTSGVFASGQKVWMTDRGDWSFLELTDITFGEK